MDSCPDEVFEDWRAHYRVEPWGNEEFLLARIASYLSALVSAKGEAGNDWFQQLHKFMPPDWYYQPETRKQSPQQSTADQLEQVKHLCGDNVGVLEVV